MYSPPKRWTQASVHLGVLDNKRVVVKMYGNPSYFDRSFGFSPAKEVHVAQILGDYHPMFMRAALPSVLSADVFNTLKTTLNKFWYKRPGGVFEYIPGKRVWPVT